jgi:2-polyprenyl-3-methyl-5-hydroxy-6-metoxy-1,4-benzoquinol methylase
MTTWNEHQEFEKGWWSDCLNTFTEETKQLTYAYKMGLTVYSNTGKWPCYNIDNKNILDIGGGPVSILLKCENRGPFCRVIDPCSYPTWVRNRYKAGKIEYQKLKGEDILYDEYWDEVWIYNVLQHTEDPEMILYNAKNAAPLIRIFEWVDMPPSIGHPQELKKADLNKWLGGIGTVEELSENGCFGKAYYGVFPTGTE